MTVKIRRLFSPWLLGGIILIVCSNSPIKPGQEITYKKIRIPFNMLTGIPFTKDSEGGEYYTEGFEVDSDGNFYFLGGKKATLACFSKEGKSIYRKSSPNFVPGQLHILGGKLYFFEIGDNKLNTLVEADKSSGSFIRTYPKTFTKALKSYGYRQIYYYEFTDSLLKITYIDSEGIEKTKQLCFDLKGDLQSNCIGDASISSAIKSSHRLLGKLGNYFVLGKFDDNDKNKYDLSLRDSLNRVISNSFVDLRYVGKPFCGTDCAPPEHRILRNNKLYLLNRDNNVAEITEIDLASMFHVQ